MEFPFNHGHNSSKVTHTHHHNRRDEQQHPPPAHHNNNTFSPFNQPPHQPPFHADSSPPPPPPQPLHPQPKPQVFHTRHVSHENFNHSSPHPPPPPHSHDIHSFKPNYGAPPPAPPSVPNHSSTPFPNSTVHHVSHETVHHPNFPSNVHHINHDEQGVFVYKQVTINLEEHVQFPCPTKDPITTIEESKHEDSNKTIGLEDIPSPTDPEVDETVDYYHYGCFRRLLYTCFCKCFS
ncbi:hypothetical protein P8452_44671 [Trifolium repens]|nr:TMV resistance protein N [Trifolium repens]WJX59334.1 hypothetical protein P8452_44671 [Trifolium repens]